MEDIKKEKTIIIINTILSHIAHVWQVQTVNYSVLIIASSAVNLLNSFGRNHTIV